MFNEKPIFNHGGHLKKQNLQIFVAKVLCIEFGAQTSKFNFNRIYGFGHIAAIFAERSHFERKC